MTTIKPVDEYDELAIALQNLFGREDIVRQSVQKINDRYDGETGERVVWVEYRYRTANKEDAFAQDEKNAIQSLIGKAALELQMKKNAE